MTKLIIAPVQGSDRDGYRLRRLHPNFGEYAGLAVAEWKVQCAEDGVTVTENAGLNGRVENQKGTVYHCVITPELSMDVCVWEETD